MKNIKSTKRLLSMVLAILLLVGVLPIRALADFDLDTDQSIVNVGLDESQNDGLDEGNAGDVAVGPDLQEPISGGLQNAAGLGNGLMGPLGSGDTFSVTFATTYRKNGTGSYVTYNNETLGNYDRLKFDLRINAEGSLTGNETFSVKIPRIFDENISNVFIDIPLDVNTGSPLFSVSGPVPDSGDSAYNVYSFAFSQTTKDAMASGGTWTFAAGNLKIDLSVLLTSDNKSNSKPVIFTDTSGSEIQGPKPNVPEDKAAFTINKDLTAVFRKVNEVWTKVDLKVKSGDRDLTAVRPDDVILFRISTKNVGNIAGICTVTETLPTGLKGYDNPDAALLAMGTSNYSVNTSNFVMNTAPYFLTVYPGQGAAWVKNSDTEYKLTFASKTANQQEPYAFFWAQVLDHETLNSGRAWSDAQLLNTVTESLDSKSASAGVTSDPIYLDQKFDVALQKWLVTVKRDGNIIGNRDETVGNGTYLSSCGEPDNIIMAGDYLTFKIRVTNQSYGDSTVKIGEIVDYVPAGLEYLPAETLAANQNMAWNVNNVANGTDKVTSSAILDPTERTVRAVTRYRLDLSGKNILLEPGQSTMVSIVFKVLDLDETLNKIDAAAFPLTETTKAADIIANRKMAESSHGGKTSYLIYYNAAEVSKVYAKAADGEYTVLLDDANADDFAVYKDVDSTLDDNPFNDVWGVKANETYRNSSGVVAPNGKEKNDNITEDAKAESTKDEDDYDFSFPIVSPKLLLTDKTVVTKKLDLLPLGLGRAAYGNEQNRVQQYLQFILRGLTEGNRGSEDSGFYGADMTGSVYGTHTPTSISGGSGTGRYQTGNPVALNRIAGMTDSYPGGVALPNPYTSYKTASYDGSKIYIDGKNTVVMYTVAVNPSATQDLEDVVLTDKIPEGFRLLTDVNGVPLVRITRYTSTVKDNARDSEDPTKIISVIDRSDPNAFEIYDVKQFASYDYLDNNNAKYVYHVKGFGANVSTVGGIYWHKDGSEVKFDDVTGNRSGYWSGKISASTVNSKDPATQLDYTQDLLTVALGDIGNNSYDVSYLLVSDKDIDGEKTITNTATISANETSESASSTRTFTWSSGAIASFYTKDIMDGETSVRAKPVVFGADGKATVTYRIGVKSSYVKEGDNQLVFEAKDVKITDTLQAPEGVKISSVDIAGVKVDEYKYSKNASGAETQTIQASSTAIDPTDVTYASGKVSITNGKAMPANRIYYITFSVTYEKDGTVPAGTIIKNTVGSTVSSYTPVEVNLVKQNAAGSKLAGAEFAVFYANADGIAPSSTLAPITDAQGNLISGSVVATDAQGKAQFFFAPPSAEFAAKSSWVIFVKETKFPEGYNSAAEVLVKYTITKKADGTLLVINEGAESSNTSGEITSAVTNTAVTGELLTIGKHYKLNRAASEDDKNRTYDFSFKVEKYDVTDGWSVFKNAKVTVMWNETDACYIGAVTLDGLSSGAKYRVSEIIPVEATYVFDWDSATKNNASYRIGSDGTLEFTSLSGEPAMVTGVNSETGFSINIDGTKVVNGDGAPVKTFTFELYKATVTGAVWEADGKAVAQETTTGAGNFSFAINISDAQLEGMKNGDVRDFCYIVKEVSDNTPGWTFDEAERHATVRVTKAGDDTYSTEVSVVDGKGTASTSATFTNTYVPGDDDSGDAGIKIGKYLDLGHTPTDEEKTRTFDFDFVLERLADADESKWERIDDKGEVDGEGEAKITVEVKWDDAKSKFYGEVVIDATPGTYRASEVAPTGDGNKWYKFYWDKATTDEYGPLVDGYLEFEVENDAQVMVTGTNKVYDAALIKWVTKATYKDASDTVKTRWEAQNPLLPNTDVPLVKKGDFVEFTIRVYNQGSEEVTLPEIVDYLPAGYEFVTKDASGNTVNGNWKVDDTLTADDVYNAVTNPQGRNRTFIVYTGIKDEVLRVSPAVKNPLDNQVCDDNTYTRTFKIIVKVSENADKTNLVNFAEIAGMTDVEYNSANPNDPGSAGNPVDDIDSTPDKNPDNDKYDSETDNNTIDKDGKNDDTKDEDDHDPAEVKLAAGLTIGKYYDFGRTATPAEKLQTHDFTFKIERQNEDGSWEVLDGTSPVKVNVKWDDTANKYYGKTELDALEPGNFRVSEIISADDNYTFAWDAETLKKFTITDEGLVIGENDASSAMVTGVNTVKPTVPQTPTSGSIKIGKYYDLGRTDLTAEEKAKSYDFSFRIEGKNASGNWTVVYGGAGVNVKWNEAKGMFYGEITLSDIAPGEYRVSEVAPANSTYSFEWDAATKAAHSVAGGVVTMTVARGSSAMVTGVNTEPVKEGKTSIVIGKYYDIGRTDLTAAEKNLTYSFSFKVEKKNADGSWSVVNAAVPVGVHWNEAEGRYIGRTTLDNLEPGDYRVGEVIPASARYTFTWDAATRAAHTVTGGTVVLKTEKNKAAMVTGINTEPLASIVLTGKKTAEGRGLIAGEFNFAVFVQGTDKRVSSGTHDADGNITFAPIVYSEEGTYKYTVKETSKGGNGWTTDTRAYDISVIVSKNPDKTLSASLEAGSPALNFHNVYSPPVTPGDNRVSLVLNKSLTDSDGNIVQTGKPFAVRIYDESGNLIERVILYSNTGSVTISGLSHGKTYYIMEEEYETFSILGYYVSGVGFTAGDAIGIHMPDGNQTVSVSVTVRNETIPDIDVPDEPPPLGPGEPPENPPVIDIPDDPTPLAPGDPQNPGNPRTGDTSMIGLWATLALVSLGGVSLLIVPARSKRKAK